MSLRGQKTGLRSLALMDRYLVVWVGERQVAFSAEAVQGLLTIEESGSGWPLTVQGQVYAPVNLATRLGLSPDDDGPDTRMILLVQGTARACVRVARVHGLVEIERGQLLPLPHQFRGAERDWYAGVMLLGEGIVVVLRTQWLLDGAESASSSGSEFQGPWHHPVPDPVSLAIGEGTAC